MGYGSGYWRAKHPTTSDVPSIDVHSLQRRGFLNPGHTHTYETMQKECTEIVNIRAEDDHLIIDYYYQHNDNKMEHTNYKFMIDWMSCHLGGKRAFFLCPNCVKRVTSLYIVHRFACRHCHHLAYACQGENAENRYARQANKIREKLGWKIGILNPMGDKPKGMHVETFEQLIDKEAWYASKVLNSMSSFLKK